MFVHGYISTLHVVHIKGLVNFCCGSVLCYRSEESTLNKVYLITKDAVVETVYTKTRVRISMPEWITHSGDGN